MGREKRRGDGWGHQGNGGTGEEKHTEEREGEGRETTEDTRGGGWVDDKGHKGECDKTTGDTRGSMGEGDEGQRGEHTTCNQKLAGD